MDPDAVSNDTPLGIDFTQDTPGNGIPMDEPPPNGFPMDPLTGPSDWNSRNYKNRAFLTKWDYAAAQVVR
jgi:hypothetical protein